MKAFRGTLIVGIVLLVVWGLVTVLDPSVKPTEPTTRRLFSFEKQDVARVEIVRPDGTIVLSEGDDGWLIEGTEFKASRSMVNRIKHQLHDLEARAVVVENPAAPELYGLGQGQAIHVTLTFRDGKQLSFLAGDPNPSGVSYYIQPEEGGTVYTVKKSAVDYYSLGIDEYRERRYATFDSKDAIALEAEFPRSRHPTLRFVATDENTWELVEPRQMGASLDEVRSLLGRVSAMKALDFVADLEDLESESLAPYGLDLPRARITVRFGTRTPMTLLVGDTLTEDERLQLGLFREEVAWAMLEGEPTVFVSREGLMEDYLQEPSTFRNERIMRVRYEDVREAFVHLEPTPEDPELTGEVRLIREGDVWLWDYGHPVPGSTPERVGMRAAGVEAEEFVEDRPTDLARYGLDKPMATIRVTVEGGGVRTLLLGREGPPRETFEGRVIQRYYAKVEGEDPVYLVDRGVLEVARDALREFRRKEERELDKEARIDRMEQALEDRGESLNQVTSDGERTP